MRVVIAGGHGKIALLLSSMLASRGDTPCGLIRNTAHADDLRTAGAESPVLDLERADVDDVARCLDGADAVVFAAGAGTGSSAERKDTVDRGAAVLLADAAGRAGVRRFLQISAMGLDRADDPTVGEVFAAYLRAKADAERDLRGRDLAWTILRPGRLTDGPGTARVRLAQSVPSGEISRTDVAAVLLALLDEPRASHRTLELVAGDEPIAAALASAVRPT